MLVRELLTRLEHGQSIKYIAEQLRVSPKTIQKRLREKGYYWDNSRKRWIFDSDSAPSSIEPLEDEILEDNIQDDFDGSVTPPVTPPINKERVRNTSTDIPMQFTSEEVADIRAMLEEWKQKEPKQEESQLLHDRIKAIVSQNKIRKTVIINEDISKRLDSFSESERVNKSDVVELALMDFIERYSK